MGEAPARVVVTGLGGACPLGTGVARFWPRMLAGRCAIGPFTLFPNERHRTHLAAVTTAAPLSGERPPLSRADRFAIAAAREAVAQAGLDPGSSPRLGLVFGSSTGGLLEGERFFAALHADARERGARMLAVQQNNAPGDAVARDLGIRGPVQTLSTACVSASMALDQALAMLRAGECDVMLAGGSDGLCQVTYAGFNALRAVDARPTRPFRTDRAGLSLGEGAGVLVLETEAHARARGAVVLAEFVGSGCTCDADHMSAPLPDGSGAAAAIHLALEEAGLGADDVDFVNAHGTGTFLNDAAESHALRLVFGSRTAHLPLTSTKGGIGHLLGSSGGIEAVVVVLGLLDGLVPPTPGVDAADPDLGVDLVIGEARRPARCQVGLSTNLAFGGANTALLFRRMVDPSR